DRNYRSIGIKEELSVVSKLLKGIKYLVPIDENLKPIGILTIEDIHERSNGKIIDIDISKPRVSPEDTLIAVMGLMQKNDLHYLPVFDRDKFIGVVSLTKIANEMAGQLTENNMHYHKVIHDVKNPISNIKGLTTLLSYAKTEEEHREILYHLDVSYQQAIEILDDLLYIEQNEMVLKYVELNDFYRQCSFEQRGLALLKNIEIVENFSSDRVLKKIDERKLKRAVQNVISNAIKFSYPFSKIKISTKFDGKNLVFKITDCGVGIAINAQPHIFGKFSSAQRPGTNGETSTGLGLYFTKQCVEAHNGKIAFKSIEGKGTKFYITI
ncbi:MAG: ATP-binding protein, partial [Olivibacter sp.]|nr:ATP-binding protein [Olivibacter sp. UJ_SKK_5.1]